jgi:hypothetical protein
VEIKVVKSCRIEVNVVKSRNNGFFSNVLKKGSKSGNIMERYVIIRSQGGGAAMKNRYHQKFSCRNIERYITSYDI